MVDIKTLEILYFSNGYSVPYKLKSGEEIEIKPILVKDFEIYNYAKKILEINKNEINDLNIIQMSYLDFLISIVLRDKGKINELCTLINLCFGEEYIYFGMKDGKSYLNICDENKNIKFTITSKDFDDIKKIILYQNDYNYNDRYISQDVRKEYEEYCKLKYKEISSPSLEKMKAFVIGKNGYKLEEINNMTYRMFYLVYHSCVDSEIYIGSKIIQGSYKYDVKKEIMHPQFEKEKDPILEMFSDADAFKNKIQQVNG